MITITPLQINQIVIWKDLYTAYDEFRVKFTKIDSKQVITCSFASITEYEVWTLFVIEDVQPADVNLNTGKVALSMFPGEWNFELQSKTTLASTWTTVYRDLMRVIDKNTKFQSI